MPPKTEEKTGLEYEVLIDQYLTLVDERREWEDEWKLISDYLLPGRGIYTFSGKPQKRTLSSPKLINTIGTDALNVLASGFHGGLTSPNRQWVQFEWANRDLARIPPLKSWLQNAEDVLHRELHDTNFYSVIQSFYPEHAGFGTAALYVGEDSGKGSSQIRFELLTAGEYAYSLGADGRMDTFFRVITMTARTLVDTFGIDRVSKTTKDRYEKEPSQRDVRDIQVLEAVLPIKTAGKPFTQVFYEYEGSPRSQSYGAPDPKNIKLFLSRKGFHEMPYFTARWEVIGSDIYGVGPGSRVLPDIKRLQEMEKSFLKGVHKAVDPPLNVPTRLRGNVQSMPGGITYFSNPNDKITELYQVRLDFQGASAAIERVEQRIQRAFFVDIFLTAARDPNASPLKATEVNSRENEKLLRLGPVIERLQHELFRPLIVRCFNILLRKKVIPPVPEEFRDLVGDGYNLKLIGPLAHAQKLLALQGINSFLGFVASAAQIDQTVLDAVDGDKTVEEVADISGVPVRILRTPDEIKALREQRAAAQQQQAQQQAQMAQAAMSPEIELKRAQAAKARADAGVSYVDAQSGMEMLGQ